MENKKYFVPYITAGFPDRKRFLKYLKLLSEYGDYVEIGIPFSDPLADGSDLQIAHETALKEKVDIDFIFSSIERIRNKKPFIIMSYLNPILNYGFEKFLKKAGNKGVAGVVIPDLPLEEAGYYLPLFKKCNLDFVPLASPSTSVERFLKIAEIANLFIYFVSVKGTTGAREDFPEYTRRKLKEFRNLTDRKIFLGFGVKNPQSVKKILNLIDGVIIGSEIARRILKGRDLNKFIKKHLNVLKGGLKNGRRMVDKGCKRCDKSSEG